MKNPDYHPDKAHLFNTEDMRRWKKEGKKKHDREERRIRSTVERFARNGGFIPSIPDCSRS